MVTHLESHVALSPPAKPAADSLHPLILQGPTGTAVALAASAISGLCPWGLAGLRFGCAECHLQELLLPRDAAAASSCCQVFRSQNSMMAVLAPWGNSYFSGQAPPCRVMSTQV